MKVSWMLREIPSVMAPILLLIDFPLQFMLFPCSYPACNRNQYSVSHAYASVIGFQNHSSPPRTIASPDILPHSALYKCIGHTFLLLYATVVMDQFSILSKSSCWPHFKSQFGLYNISSPLALSNHERTPILATTSLVLVTLENRPLSLVP